MVEHDGADQVADITAGYVFEGPTLQLGAALVDGTLHTGAQVRLPLAMMNRHGLIAGATGTGKTVTLQVLAEQLSAHGVPVFLSDIKGDLTGLATPGTASERLAKRTTSVGQDWAPAAFPVEFLSLGRDGNGIPVRATISSFGPLLLSRVMDLNETQESSLQLVFHYADRNGLELYDLADLRAVIGFLTSAEGKEALELLGGLSKATAGVILRELVALEAQGMDAFFGEPEFDTADLLRTAADGRGIITALELVAVQQKPRLFSTFLMWLLADLFAELPEVGDVDKPRLVFFLDEAHLLFTGSSKAFRESIQATVRLIRSKGVGIFFITQTPRDLPGEILGQLANRVQHALRAYTPDDAKALRATVSTFPTSPYDLEEVLTSAGIGEAVVTVLNEHGAPTPVAWTRLRSPASVMGRAPEGTVPAAVASSPLLARYGESVDRHSAFETLAARDAPGGAADGGSGTRADPPAGTGVASRREDRDAEARRIEDEILGTSSPPAGPGTGYGSGGRGEGDGRRSGQGRAQRTDRWAGRAPDRDEMADLALRAAGVIGKELARGLFGTRRRRRPWS
ncbi:ATP-binding protein [Arthrobacter agilis]|uniref:ATP-binding protein n=1 Tax=Arthrobacter agilis TaxID=37921 RepID=A0A2L0UG19_9MICC|nr:helicase HerA-like domain-containing protein [Arthrobacter agilis]AUZ88201.1 ATP-binding protein [Arthrobacter agilis]